jgi:hypothetical protein
MKAKKLKLHKTLISSVHLETLKGGKPNTVRPRTRCNWPSPDTNRCETDPCT